MERLTNLIMNYEYKQKDLTIIMYPFLRQNLEKSTYKKQELIFYIFHKKAQ